MSDREFPSPPSRPTPAAVEEFLEAVVVHFVLAQEDGLDPDIDAYLARYPRHSEDLAFLLGQEGGRPVVDQEPSTAARARARGWPVERYGDHDVLFHVVSTGGSHVYKARHRETGEDVAVKVVRRLETIDPREIKRFQREASTLADIASSGVIRVLEVGERDEGCYMVMPWIDGMTLQEVVDTMAGRRRPGAFDPTSLDSLERGGIIAKVARTLADVHARGILHRDLKPSNVMLTVDLEPILIDFGIARHDDYSRVTRTADAPLGTPRYLAPELLLGDAKTADERTDVYGLGMTLYEFLTGTRAFDATDRVDLFTQILKSEVRPPRHVDPAIPKALSRVTMRAIERSPSKRWRSMAAFADALTRVIGERPSLVDRVLRRVRPRE